ncbi:hypothetical protein ANCCAN_13767 [Ancylostoma caninum]|uniref:Uncharacterized protein n=1 Tax=Ancylostoma caninum TaxID=29170 RepID=A0A368GB90_ANCCA|nr:hypothetical protein ANCCAN_13767 [Ancylostoma caninum]
MGIQSQVVISGGYPAYSAATIVELWMNNTDNQPYFKLLYRTSDVEDEIYPITPKLYECGGKAYCKLDVFRSYAARTKIEEPDMEKWCSTDPRKNAAISLWSFSTIAFILMSYSWSHI